MQSAEDAQCEIDALVAMQPRDDQEDPRFPSPPEFRRIDRARFRVVDRQIDSRRNPPGEGPLRDSELEEIRGRLRRRLDEEFRDGTNAASREPLIPALIPASSQ